MQGGGDVAQEAIPVADRQRLGSAQHGGELIVGEAEGAIEHRRGCRSELGHG
jgi:hypothetical protein